MSAEKFCLKWNDFETNISSAFRELREDRDFFDVSLVCDEDQISAHKVILGSCSPFFRDVLRRNPHQHPLLYLKNIRFSDLESVLSFMYHGEVSVAQEQLNSFLSVAEELQVKGLTQNRTENQSRENNIKQQTSLANKQSRQHPHNEENPKRINKVPNTPVPAAYKPNLGEDDEIQEVAPVKSEPRDPPVQTVVLAAQDMYQASDTHYSQHSQVLASEDHLDHHQGDLYEDDDYQVYPYQEQQQEITDDTDPLAQLRKYIVKRGAGPERECGICYQYSNKSSTNVRNHIESKHFPGLASYHCEYCDKTCNTKQSLDTHRQRCYHNQNNKM